MGGGKPKGGEIGGGIPISLTTTIWAKTVTKFISSKEKDAPGNKTKAPKGRAHTKCETKRGPSRKEAGVKRNMYYKRTRPNISPGGFSNGCLRGGGGTS